MVTTTFNRPDHEDDLLCARVGDVGIGSNAITSHHQAIGWGHIIDVEMLFAGIVRGKSYAEQTLVSLCSRSPRDIQKWRVQHRSILNNPNQS